MGSGDVYKRQLFVNDLPLAQVTDDAFASGVIAVAAGTFAEPELTLSLIHI